MSDTEQEPTNVPSFGPSSANPEFGASSAGHTQAEANPLPPKGCICASFWTVRQTHKSDCPLAKPVDGELREQVANTLYKSLYWESSFTRQAFDVAYADSVQKLVDLFDAHLQAAVRDGRVDELQGINNQQDHVVTTYMNGKEMTIYDRLQQLKQEGK